MVITKEALHALLEKNVKGLALNNIDYSASFNELGIDSLDHASFLMAIDETYNITIPDSDVDKCYSIEATLNYIDSIQLEA